MLYNEIRDATLESEEPLEAKIYASRYMFKVLRAL